MIVLSFLLFDRNDVLQGLPKLTKMVVEGFLFIGEPSNFLVENCDITFTKILNDVQCGTIGSQDIYELGSVLLLHKL